MSGGHFNGNGYIYYQVDNFADELEFDIEKNDIPDEYQYAPRFSSETLAYLKSQIHVIRKMAKVMKEIDYLYSGDHGEDSFMRVVDKIEKEKIE